jgi:hypothetical protein
MNFLPVVQRELLVAARMRSDLWFRFVAALGGMAFFVLLWSTPIQSQPQLVSDIVFRVLGGALFGFALFSGSLYTADAMTSEKRQGTLGLLFLTELRGYDIVLGKLAATSLRAVYGVIALIPVLSLPVLVGGVSGGQVARLVFTLLVTMLASLSIGMMASVISRDFRGALGASMITAVILAFGLDGAGWVWHRATGKPAEAIRLWSPLAAFRWSQAEPWREPLKHAAFKKACKRQALAGVALLAVASVTIRGYRDRVIEAPRKPAGEGVVRRGSLVGYRHLQWGDVLERQPYAWFQLVMRPVPLEFQLAYYGLAGAVILALGVSVGISATPGALWAVGAAFFLLWTMHLLLKVQVTLAATRGIAEDRASGALELLVVAGQGREQIIRGHQRALFLQHRTAVLVLVGLQFVPILRVSMSDLSLGPAAALCVGLIYGAGALWLDLETLAQVGLRHGLKESNPLAAFRATFLRVMLPAWLGLLPLAVLLFSGAAFGTILVVFHVWLLWAAYTVYRVRKRSRIDLEHGFQTLATGLHFDTDDWELRDDFRRAAGAQYPTGEASRW